MRNFLRLILIIACPVSMALAEDAGLSDPTRPSGFSEHTAPLENTDEKLSLTLIRLGTAPLAVINGKNVQPGEFIAGYKLVSLQARSATLVGSNGRIVLQLASAIHKSINYSAQNR